MPDLQGLLNKVYDEENQALRLSGAGLAPAWTEMDPGPVLSAGVTPPTMGTGASSAGKYLQIGSLVIYQFNFIFGTAGVDPGEGDLKIPLPVTAVYRPGPSGTSTLVDISAGGSEQANVCFDPLDSSGDYCFLVNHVLGRPGETPVGDFSDRNVTDAIPWTWEANDQILGWICYEAA